MGTTEVPSLRNKVTETHLSEMLMLLERNDFIIVKNTRDTLGDITFASDLIDLLKKESDHKDWFRFR